MKPATRIILNTCVQYFRTFVSMLIMLFTTRILMDVMGHSNYGLYSVVGSIVFMIGFITSSLASSTQRFLSYSHGLNDKQELRNIFANAFYVHLFIAALIAIVMTIGADTFVGNLNITPAQNDAAWFVYFAVLIMVLITFVTAPLRALYIARENILYVSVVEIIDAFIKLAGALLLTAISFDALKAYALFMVLVSVFNFVAYASYALVKYEECHIPVPQDITKAHMKKLTGFAVWNIYNVGSTVVRVQGLAIIINRFLGTIVNAAYGVALQVSNAVSFIALSILNAMNPQIMKAEGAGNRKQMLLLATKESKYSFLVLSTLMVPLIIEMPGILSFWLGNIPDYAVMFCQFILIDQVADQLTIGLTTANQAIGKIRNYSLLTSTIRLLTLPAAWFCLAAGLPPVCIMLCFLGINIVIGIIRIPFLHYTAGLDVINYIKEVALKSLIPATGIIATAWLFTHVTPDFMFRFVVTELLAVAVGAVLIYTFAFTTDERDWTKTSLGKIYAKIS